MNLIAESFAVALFVRSIWYVMQPGEIFGKLGGQLQKLPAILHAPIFDCPVCMTFWYGWFVIWFIEGSFTISLWREYLVTIIVAMGMNIVLSSIAKE
jgi:hypothetical protein